VQCLPGEGDELERDVAERALTLDENLASFSASGVAIRMHDHVDRASLQVLGALCSQIAPARRVSEEHPLSVVD